MIALGGLWICLWRDKIRWFGVIPILAGIIMIPLTPRADILIAESGKIFAVRDDKGILWLSSEKAEKFVSQAWIEREAEPGHDFWTEKGAPVSCDDEACIYKHKDRLVSFVKKYTALKEDCAAATIVASSLYIRKHLCSAPALLASKSELKHKGAHAVYFRDDGSMALRTVYDERGVRPWAVLYRSRYMRQTLHDEFPPAQE